MASLVRPIHAFSRSHITPEGINKESTSFSEEKEAKRLLSVWSMRTYLQCNSPRSAPMLTHEQWINAGWNDTRDQSPAKQRMCAPPRPAVPADTRRIAALRPLPPA
jgi:hypothetical protein